MRPLTFGFALVISVGLAFIACSQDSGSQTTGSSGTGGAPNCNDITVVYGEDADNHCDVCLRKECCATVSACADKTCLDCANFFVPSCRGNTRARAVMVCSDGVCKDECYFGPPPFTTSSGTGGTGGASSSSSG